eukprot:jgi/Botrbrau1/11102/Bobra.0219s0011.1
MWEAGSDCCFEDLKVVMMLFQWVWFPDNGHDMVVDLEALKHSHDFQTKIKLQANAWCRGFGGNCTTLRQLRPFVLAK